MNVLRLGFENFRNLCPGEIFPGETINVIHGSNAQGKTNLLEAIWLFTGGHSFRGTKDSELPVLKDGKNAPAASLSMTLFTEGREQELRLELRDGRRSSVINGVEKNKDVVEFYVDRTKIPAGVNGNYNRLEPFHGKIQSIERLTEWDLAES